MINNHIEYLFHLCLEVQKGKDGCYEERCGYKRKPTIFFEVYGHVIQLEIRIYNHGWRAYMDPDKKFNFYLDEEIEQEKFEECRDYLLKLIEEKEEE